MVHYTTGFGTSQTVPEGPMEPAGQELRYRVRGAMSLQLMECTRLQVKELDFAQRLAKVRDGKGEKRKVCTRLITAS